MASEVLATTRRGCFRDAIKREIDRLTDRSNVTFESIDSNLTILGKVLNEGQYQYDFALTIQVIREYSTTLQTIHEEAIRTIDRLGKDPASSCGLNTDRVVQWLSKAMEPVTLSGGIISLASEAFKDAALRDPKWAIVGIALCVGSGFVSQIAHFLSDKINTYERNQAALEKIKAKVVQKNNETKFITSLFEKLDDLSKAQAAPKTREWRHLAFDAKHIPEAYHHIIDPLKFKQFVKAKSPRTRFRHIVKEAMHQHKDGKTQREETAITVAVAPVFWHG